MSGRPGGVYVRADSPLHRAPAGAKLAVLAVALLLLGAFRTPVAVGLALALVLLGYAVARVGWAVLAAQARPLLVVVPVIAVLQVWAVGPAGAVLVAAWLAVAVLAAALVTVTTPVDELLDAVVVVVRPLRRVGVDPERVALVLALAVRSVPVVAGLARDVQDARRARGAGGSVRAFAVPLVIRTVRHADRLGEALAARGVDD